MTDQETLVSENTRTSLKKRLEGPILFRILALLGGLAMVGFGIWSLVDIKDILKHPTKYIIEVYITAAGFFVVLIELKDIGGDTRLRAWFDKWMTFLTTMMGKGFFYVVCGTLCMSLWLSNLFLLGTGIYMVVLGVLLICIHLGHCGKYKEYFDEAR